MDFSARMPSCYLLKGGLAPQFVYFPFESKLKIIFVINFRVILLSNIILGKINTSATPGIQIPIYIATMMPYK